MLTEPHSLLAELPSALSLTVADLEGWGLAWARVAPAIALVPAFGLRALPGPARAALALCMAAVIAPALKPLGESDGPWPLRLLVEAAHGLPIAIAAAIPLWAATMVGGVIDSLRGANEQLSAPLVEGRPTPLGVVFSLTAGLIFLATGGPARLASALSAPLFDIADPLSRAAHDLAAGISIAIALAAPLIAASLIIEIAGALIARAASPAQLHALLAPIRSLALLAMTALLFERIASALSSKAIGLFR